MKKIYSIVTGILLTVSVLAQAPQKMSYQAVIRNSSNALVASKTVGMRISILKGSATATASPLTDYVETQIATTNANGLVSLEIGTGTPVIGTFATINWANGPYFIKTETDQTGGTNYTIVGTSELLSVPYALFSANSTPGPKGDKGETGAQGIQGIQGIQGQTGATGTFQNGTAAGQMNYWNGSAWVTVPPGLEGQAFIFCGGEPTWTTGGICPGKIASLDCATSTNNGILTQSIEASGVSSEISYSSGNGGPYSAQTVASTGVIGLTVTLQAGSFANGNGTLTYTISGTPASAGTASFAISIGGISCALAFTVNQTQYPAGTIHCTNTPTDVVSVTNPTTGKIWMDRNLGASRVATSSSDVNSYGDLYQWGRSADGHQCRNSATTSNLSSLDQPAHGNFITTSGGNYDWRSPKNDNLWQGLNGINNPCPSGYRLPTEIELDAERISWSVNTSSGAFSSTLKFLLAGRRDTGDGSLKVVGSVGYYLSSNVIGANTRGLYIDSGTAYMATNVRGYGFSLRCIKD